jgi:hypothetical protein
MKNGAARSYLAARYPSAFEQIRYSRVKSVSKNYVPKHRRESCGGPMVPLGLTGFQAPQEADYVCLRCGRP